MATRTTIVAGVFGQEAQARGALDALRQAGFDYDQVGVAMQNRNQVNLVDDLVSLGVPQERATYYDQEYKAGRIVVSVRSDGRDQEALDILRSNGAYDYDQRTTTTQIGQTTTSAQPQIEATTGDEFYQPRTLRVREERLNVDKDRVQAGEVSLHKDVVTEQRTVNVPVTHEEVVLERHPINGNQVDDAPIGEGETIRVPVSEETVDVSKDTVVTGEVAIGKHSLQETQQVSDTVRREKLHVEQEGDAPIHGTKSDRFHPDQVDKDNPLE